MDSSTFIVAIITALSALLVSLVLTIVFVLATRRRLRRQLEAEGRIEQQRRLELEAISIRFGMATQAARAGVYELLHPPEYPVVLYRLHASIWWGAMLLSAGILYCYRFAPSRVARKNAGPTG